MNPSPHNVAYASQARKISERLERTRPSRERRQRARANGYRGPLTRTDLANVFAAMTGQPVPPRS